MQNQNVDAYTVARCIILKVVELANLDGLRTPLEKLFCLKSTIVSVIEEKVMQ